MIERSLLEASNERNQSPLDLMMHWACEQVRDFSFTSL